MAAASPYSRFTATAHQDPMNQSRLRSLYFRLPLLFAVLAVIASGCSTTGTTVIKVDASDLEGVQSLRQEITWMLNDLGYDWVPVRDVTTGKMVKATRHAEQWRMLFQARDRADIKILARFDVSGYRASLGFQVAGVEELDASSEPYYRKIKERLALMYGPDNISDKGSWLGL